jgi:hypothetical protein
LCTQILTNAGFSTVFTFNPEEQVNLEADHVRAYKHLRSALWQFVENGGELDLLAKPQGAHKWIEAQKEVKQAQDEVIIEQEGDDKYISEVETKDSGSDQRSDSGDDGLLLDVDFYEGI